MSLSYGLSLNIFLVISVQFQCQLSNLIVSVERLEQYMHIRSEAPEIIEANRPSKNWPSVGKVVIENLKVRMFSTLFLQGFETYQLFAYFHVSDKISAEFPLSSSRNQLCI